MGGNGTNGDDDEAVRWPPFGEDEDGVAEVAAVAEELLAAAEPGRWERWVNDMRVEDAARRRAAERWLRQQAEEEACFGGVLVDLGERGVSVVLHTRTGRVHGGTVTQVGADFVRVTVPSCGDTLVSLDAVASVRTLPGETPVTGDRTVGSRTTLVEMITALTADRERAVIVPIDGSEPVYGVVSSVGRDLVVVHVEADGPGRPGVAYVPLAAIGEVVLGV